MRDALRLLRERADYIAYVRAELAASAADYAAGNFREFTEEAIRDVVREGRELARKRAPKTV